MATFNPSVITTQGLELLANSIAGASVVFTNIKTSSYQYPAGTDLTALTDLQDIKQTVEAEEVQRPIPTTVTVRSSIANTELTTGYYVWAIGLYAQGASGEILFAVATATAADFFPPNTAGISSIVPTFNFTVDNAANITLQVNQAGVATLKDIEELRSIIEIATEPGARIFVNNTSTKDTENGSFSYPFKTITAAIDYAKTLAVVVEIDIAPGTYTEDEELSGLTNNILLHGSGAIGQRLTTITGNVTINEDSIAVGLANINFGGELNINSKNGPVYIDNCHFVAFTTNSTTRGLIILDYCDFDSNVQLYGLANIKFRTCDFGETGIIYMRGAGADSTGFVVSCTGCENVALNKLAGQYRSLGETHYKQFAAGYAINDSSAGVGNELLLFSGTTLQETQQANGTYYAVINQSDPNGRYIIANFVREPNIDTFRGTRIDGGLHINDIFDHNSYNNITVPANTRTLDETLLALDEAIGTGGGGEGTPVYWKEVSVAPGDWIASGNIYLLSTAKNQALGIDVSLVGITTSSGVAYFNQHINTYISIGSGTNTQPPTLAQLEDIATCGIYCAGMVGNGLNYYPTIQAAYAQPTTTFTIIVSYQGNSNPAS